MERVKWGVLGTANIARWATIPGMKKAEQQIIAPATVTLVPISIWRYLLTILARMSRPPVEALILNRMACVALKIKTKQSR